MTSGTTMDAMPRASRCFQWRSAIRAFKLKACWSLFHSRRSLSAINVDGRRCKVQLSGCVEANSCVAVNLVLLLLLCLVPCGIRTVEDYECLFLWQPSLSNTVKYIVYASKQQGVYVIPTCGWSQKISGVIKNIPDQPHPSYILIMGSRNDFTFFKISK